MRKISALFIVIGLLLGCNGKKEKNVDVSNISVSYDLDRFDQDFYNTKEKSLAALKEEYPLLFPTYVPDSIWQGKRIDKDELELFEETQKIYSNIEGLKSELTDLFKHVTYYNPKFKSPKVITMLTNIDYDNRVIYADSILLVSLDAYLGPKHRFYGDYPEYIKQNNRKEHIIVDVAESILEKQVFLGRPRTFMDKMIEKGKKMFLLECYLPNVSDTELIGYSEKKYQWAQNNEEPIWKYFREKELLFDTSRDLDKRFIDIAPFSKFYLEQDNRSPGRIGVWVGWQIVRSFMKNNDVSLQELLKTNEEFIFKNSKYKPRK